MGRRADLFHLGFWSAQAIVFGGHFDESHPEVQGAARRAKRYAEDLSLPEPLLPSPDAAEALREMSRSLPRQERNLIELGLHCSLILYGHLLQCVAKPLRSSERSEMVAPLKRILAEVSAYARDAGAFETFSEALRSIEVAAEEAEAPGVVNQLEDALWTSAARLDDDAPESKASQRSDVLDRLAELRRDIEESALAEAIRHDLVHDVTELHGCVDADLRRAALSMCGRLLEGALRLQLYARGIEPDENATVGSLIRRVRDEGMYVDPALTNVWNVVNQQRIRGVHAADKHPIPSADQMLMATYAALDTVRRCL